MKVRQGSAPAADGLGSSEGAAVLGLDPFKSAHDVLRAKLEGAPEQTDAPMLRWGRLLEDVVALDLTDRTGIELVRLHGAEEGEQRTLRMRGHPIMTARLDRATRRRPRKVVEVKTSPYGSSYGDAGELADGAAGDSDGLPVRVRVQVLHQLAVTGWSEAIVAVLIGGYQRRDYVVPRDETAIGDYVDELEEWWARHYVRREPLPVDGSDGSAAYLRRAYPRETADVITATPEQTLLVRAYVGAVGARDAGAHELEIARQRLADAIGTHAGMLFSGGRVSYKAHDVHLTDWRAVAGAYRTLIEETRSLYGDADLADLPSTVRAGLADLDALESIHQRVRTDRPLLLKLEDQP
jgi:predicted phage-related endonuclease